MWRSLLILSTVVFISACTKQVPEGDKKASRSSEEIAVEQTITNFVEAYNSNDIDKAVTFFESDYKGVVSDSDDVVGLDMLKNDLTQYKKQYPGGKWEIKIDEVNISGELAYVFTSGSFLMPDPIEDKMSPIYSERAIRILRKKKNDGWSIFRYLATPTFSYDNK
ncbi:MAG: YybH family protein [Melioribacteraceae bacterium]